jgi:hypothetical protein
MYIVRFLCWEGDVDVDAFADTRPNVSRDESHLRCRPCRAILLTSRRSLALLTLTSFFGGTPHGSYGRDRWIRHLLVHQTGSLFTTCGAKDRTRQVVAIAYSQATCMHALRVHHEVVWKSSQWWRVRPSEGVSGYRLKKEICNSINCNSSLKFAMA